ncbi:NTF2-like N-terminal transpeptidase domain-containing protein [Acetomicrobium sp. S15 = DSM 107314]|uniref:NTF2-like N-terminal transpeptidase domain-containing protein n=1 Tax=Acetomicrobium sp. S15 = DSM 107314 TaxID=2529858 RepID=UPI0018E12257|nr:NTF2-like N-terminal transpeptidase domain-containing protein [Acetomicrobium sp. S15 = DSM 107314]
MRRRLALSLMLVLSFAGTLFAQDGDGEKVSEILDKWTAFHWAPDCLIWAVHYPDEIVDPWVALEASRRGLSSEEAARYRANFIRDLRLDSSEPFLVTVYHFGVGPLEFAPFSERIALLLPSGERIKPFFYEPQFDGPISGVVQGLVFFPKQEREDFELVVSGLGKKERRFSFKGRVAPEEAPTVKPVIVQLPSLNEMPKEKTQEKPSAPETPKKAAPKPSPKPEVPPPDEPPVWIVPPSAPIPPKEEQPLSPPMQPLTSEKKESSTKVPSKEEVVKRFLEAWAAGDTEEMYSFLDEESKKRYPLKTFEERVMDNSLRWALKDGYTTEWLAEDKVRVVAVQKLLVMRLLRRVDLSLVRHEEEWKIAW